MAASTEAPRARRRLPPEQRRRELLDAVAAELAATDFHALSVPAVVRRAGVSQGLFYRYFDDLDAAFVALLEDRVVPALLAATARTRLDRSDAAGIEDDLAGWFESLAVLVEEQGPLLRAALLAAPTGSGVAARYCRDLIERLRRWGEGLLEAVNGEPPFRSVDAYHVSHMVVGMTVHCALLGLEGADARSWAREMAGFEAWGLLGGPEG